MIAEYNFKCICDLTTKVLGFPDGALATKSRKRPLQVARSISGYIARTEEDIDRKIIAKGLNRNRSLIYHYEKCHKKNYATCLVYRNTFNKLYKAYKDLNGTKEVFVDNDFMKHYLLKNGVVETLKPEVLLEIKSGQSICVIKTSYMDFSNQVEKIKFALKNYHFTINIK
jgi:transcription antitermination factor NusG